VRRTWQQSYQPLLGIHGFDRLLVITGGSVRISHWMALADRAMLIFFSGVCLRADLDNMKGSTVDAMSGKQRRAIRPLACDELVFSDRLRLQMLSIMRW